jgi:O-antigen/teichoic acid export membrane protein
MGVIQRQSIRSTVLILLGFGLGAFNMLVLVPRILTTEELGLTRVITDAGITLATLCTLGCTAVINKFAPFYKSHLSPKKNDLPFFTLTLCLTGFVVVCVAGYLGKDLIVRKFSERSPLFVEYSFLVYPYCFFMLMFMWMEGFAWSFNRGILSNGLREIVPRVVFLAILVLFVVKLISLDVFLLIFSLSYLLPSILMFIALRRTDRFYFQPEPSNLTNRLRGKMVNFGLFVFGAHFLNLLSRTVDTFILSAKSDRGLTDTAVFTIATYIVTLMEVPQRSMNSSVVPVLAEAWKNKDFVKIRNVYHKSVSNLLLVGLFMFGLMWLNIHNISEFLGKNFSGIEAVILLMGIGKLIDLGTGANGQIIGTSNFWKVDFTTNVIYTLLALPLNYFLIAHYGLLGAAYSSLISLTFYNILRFGFLKYKYNLQPYSKKEFLAVLVAIICAAIAYFIPRIGSLFLDAFVRSVVFTGLLLPAIYHLRVSEEVNKLIEKYALMIKSKVRTS